MGERYPSEKAERFQVRLPDGLRDEIKAAAEANGRSMNAEIVARLQNQPSLRDLFACEALGSLMSQRVIAVDNLGYVLPSEKEPLCRAAYRFADAMLKARGE